MNPFDTLGTVIVGIYKTGKLQGWCKLIASVLASSYVTFLGVWGTSILAMYKTTGYTGAVVLGFANGCIMTSVVVLLLWKKSPLSKGIPIAVPGRIEAEAIKMLEGEGLSITTPK